MNRMCIMLAVIVAVALAIPGLAATVTFRVSVPSTTPSATAVYIAGNFQGWNPGSAAHALTKQADGTWQITLSLPDGAPIQYKFTRGSWATVEKGPNGEEIANRSYTPSGTATLNLTVANWADQPVSTIVGHVESFQFAPFMNGRKCWVYLPPGYATSTDRYPVLYMHDGQNLFDVATSFAGEWRVDEACEALIASGEIPPIIVIGIENAGGGRCNEYTPWAKSGTGGPCVGGGADTYLSAIRDVLIPEVNRRYRTRTGSRFTFMSGSSLGGLVSIYAAYGYSDVWGRVAAVSPSIWWREQELLGFAIQTGRPPTLDRYYQDMGTQESGFTDNNGNGIDDYIEDLRAMKTVALSQGFIENDDFKSLEAAGHSHNEFYWSQRMPGILRFLTGDLCLGDFNDDRFVDAIDYDLFIVAWLNGQLSADVNHDGFADAIDYDVFIGAWIGGC